MFCYVSQQDKVVVVLSIGEKDISKGSGTEDHSGDEMSTTIPVNIAVIPTS
jgi:hypothetical protein